MNIITSTIGNNYSSNFEDIKKIRNNFNLLGIHSGDEDHGYIDHDLDNAIRSFQRGMDLKEDGIMMPNGETETRLRHVLHLVSEGKITAPVPIRKPLQKTPPLPERKPLPTEEKEIIQQLKEEYEAEMNIKKLYDFVKKKNPIGLMKELSDKTQEIYNEPDGKI